MSKLKISNPVTAIAETDATGEIADIFADIRETYDDAYHRTRQYERGQEKGRS